MDGIYITYGNDTEEVVINTNNNNVTLLVLTYNGNKKSKWLMRHTQLYCNMLNFIKILKSW